MKGQNVNHCVLIYRMAAKNAILYRLVANMKHVFKLVRVVSGQTKPEQAAD
jgi:hypothetical protein